MIRPTAALAVALIMLVAFAVASAWQSAMAQAPEVQVTLDPPTPITVGDLVEIQVRVQHAVGASVSVQGSVVQLGGMEPAAAVASTPSETLTILTYRTRSFAVGTFEAPLPDVLITDSGGTTERISPPSVAISVESVLSDPAEPRPLTAPNLLEGDARTFAPWIVAIIGVGVGFVLARLVRRWRRASPSPMPTVVADEGEHTTPAFEMDASLPSAEQCRRLAAAVRARLADDWPLPASALTAAEIGPALARAGAPSAVVLRVTQLLEACDRVQYGGEQPTPERLSGYAQQAAAIWLEAAHEGG